MDTADAERIRQRDIALQPIHPHPHQARAAAEFLREVSGILETRPLSPVLLRIRYDLLYTCLQEIEEALTELGLHLDNSLMYRLRRALYYYTEDTLRTNLGYPAHHKNDCTRRIFAKRYELIEHGCRDNRPEHWRRYL